MITQREKITTKSLVFLVKSALMAAGFPGGVPFLEPDGEKTHQKRDEVVYDD